MLTLQLTLTDYENIATVLHVKFQAYYISMKKCVFLYAVNVVEKLS